MVTIRPLQISPETARKLAAMLNIPIEHLLHMPQHILMQKLAALAKQQDASAETGETPRDGAENGKET